MRHPFNPFHMGIGRDYHPKIPKIGWFAAPVCTDFQRVCLPHLSIGHIDPLNSPLVRCSCYLLENAYATNWTDPPFLMGKSTINGNFQMLSVSLPEGKSPSIHWIDQMKSDDPFSPRSRQGGIRVRFLPLLLVVDLVHGTTVSVACRAAPWNPGGFKRFRHSKAPKMKTLEYMSTILETLFVFFHGYIWIYLICIYIYTYLRWWQTDGARSDILHCLVAV